jgi:ferredoxin
VYTVELKASGESFEIEPDEIILDAAQRAGIVLAFSCQSGTCRSCMTQVLSGIVEHDPEYIDDLHIDPDEIEDGYRLLCSAFARSDITLDK